MPAAWQAYYTVRKRLSAFLNLVSNPQLTHLSLLTFGLRLKKNRWFRKGDVHKKQIASPALSPGERLFVTGVRLAALPKRSLSLCCGWSRDNKDDEPWYILSDLPADHQVLAT